MTCKNGHGGADGVTKELNVGDAEKIHEIGKQLKEEIEQSEQEEVEKRREAIRHSGDRPDSWPSANRPKEKPLDPRFARITERIFVEDPEGLYKKLEENLRVGEERSDRGILLRALDNAETNARDAHRLWVTAKLEQQRYEITNKIVFAAIREEANRTLQREKDQKLRSKQITEEDIDTMAAQLFPDEYEEQKISRHKAELMVKSMENLSELWLKRCSALEIMLGKSR